MRCPKCGSVTAVSHSNMQNGAQYRKRYCTSLECRHAFSTWETTTSPARAAKPASRGGMSVAQKRKKHREDTRRARAADPEKLKRDVQRWRIRRQARAEAAATGEPVEAIYARWGVD